MKALLVMLCAFTCASCLAQSAAAACDCPAMGAEQSGAVIESAALIFEGTVAGLDQPPIPEENFDYNAPRPVAENPVYAAVSLKIVRPLKGGAEGDRIDAYIDTASDCGMMVEQGDEDLFVLLPQDGVLVQAGQCSMPLREDLAALSLHPLRETPDNGSQGGDSAPVMGAGE